MERKFVILCLERSADGVNSWWKPNRNGYTTSFLEAGKYSREEAETICAEANRFGKIEEETVEYGSDEFRTILSRVPSEVVAYDKVRLLESRIKGLLIASKDRDVE